MTRSYLVRDAHVSTREVKLGVRVSAVYPTSTKRRRAIDRPRRKYSQTENLTIAKTQEHDPNFKIFR
jgi:hypothetical protein